MLLLALVLLGAAHLTASSTFKPKLAREEVLYHSGEKVVLRCVNSTENGTKPIVKWRVYPVYVGRTSWKHLGVWNIWSVDVHDNELILVAGRSSGVTTTTVLCMVKGKLGNNVKRVFNLVKDVERRPTVANINWKVKPQVCPLHRNKMLTLTCHDAVNYKKVVKWRWYRNTKRLVGEDKAEINVDKPGLYTCHFYSHERMSRQLLTFKVRKASKRWQDNELLYDWAFCRYTDHVTPDKTEMTSVS